MFLTQLTLTIRQKKVEEKKGKGKEEKHSCDDVIFCGCVRLCVFGRYPIGIQQPC